MTRPLRDDEAIDAHGNPIPLSCALQGNYDNDDSPSSIDHTQVLMNCCERRSAKLSCFLCPFGSIFKTSQLMGRGTIHSSRRDFICT